MDTKKPETTAVDFISSRLQDAELYVAEPKFDIKGTDLLVFSRMDDGVKFCRIQCKGRSVANKSTKIEIPEEYVTNGFLVCLYVRSGTSSNDFYCFLANDVRNWHKNEKQYTLSISKGNYLSKLKPWLFDSEKVEIIKDIIRRAEVAGEFEYLIRATLKVRQNDATVVSTGKIS